MNHIAPYNIVYIPCIIVKLEPRILATLLIDQRCRPVTDNTSHEECADVRIWRPGDVTISPNVQCE